MTVRVEKRKWDGSVSAVDTARPLAVPGGSSAWIVPAGSRRERPASGATEDASRSFTGYKVHASAPFETPERDDEIVWIDLDLDFEVTGDDVEIEDEAQFHDHARTMGYPDEVVRGAWSGISTIAARYTNGDWPFDGSMQGWVDGA